MPALGFEAAALAASVFWAVGGLIVAGPAKTLGGPRLTRLRMYWVVAILLTIASLVGGWASLDGADVALLGLSGLFGLAMGDVALFTAFDRLGPRRTGILFATNAPMAAIISAVFFGERFSIPSLLGTVLILSGVTLAIAFGSRPGQNHHWEDVRGNLWIGVAFGLLGALGQALGVIVADPVFDGQVNTWAGAAVRATVGLVALVMLRPYFEKRARLPYPQHIPLKLWGILILSGTIGMVIGKTLVLVALRGGDPGIVSVLISTSPALQLPLIWLVTKERPAAGAWAGAALAALGTALIVT